MNSPDCLVPPPQFEDRLAKLPPGLREAVAQFAAKSIREVPFLQTDAGRITAWENALAEARHLQLKSERRDAADGATAAPGPKRFLSIALGTRQFLEREYPKPRNLIGDGILCAGDFAILYGVPGGGKTFAALQLARALVRGEKWFGLPTGAGGPVRVGILELEVNGGRLQARLRTIAGDAGVDERDDALVLVCRPDLQGRVNVLDPTDMVALTIWCREARLDLLIVDALNRVHTVDENQAFDMSPVLAALDQLRFETGTAILLLHHEPKSSSGGREVPDLDALRGTSRLRDDPNLLMRLVKKQGNLRCLRFPKVNNAEEPSPIWLVQTKAGPLEVTAAPEQKGERNREKVQAALVDGAPFGLTNEEIQNQVGLKRAAVSKHLAALGAVEIPGKPPRYLPSSTASTEDSVEGGSSYETSELAAEPSQLPLPRLEHLPSSTPSTLKGGKARGSWGGLVPDEQTGPRP